MKGIHGGDIYRNRVAMDFSVNVNPLGIPQEVSEAMYEAVPRCSSYPDIEAEKLKQAVSGMLQVPEEYLLFGNGASELLMAVIHALRPKQAVIPVPSFYGYEYAAGAGDGQVIYYETKQEHDFALREDFRKALSEESDLLFLANPNNPTGNLMSREELRALLRHCRGRGICVVLDECFIDFCEGEASMLPEIAQFENLILVRAFTKICAVPGVRLGYLVCADQSLLEKIRRQLPEWNLSGLAQAAGCACAAQAAFIKDTAVYVAGERKRLSEGLTRLGVRVFPGAADFLLVYSGLDLYGSLLQRGILIRDCSNFRGLRKGFCRIAVRSREENETLLEVLEDIYGTEGERDV